MTCVQITQRRHKSQRGSSSLDFCDSLQLTKHQARMLATELMLFAEGREVDEFEELAQQRLEQSVEELG